MNRSLYLNRWLNSFYILFLISLYLFFAPFKDGPEIFPHTDKIGHFFIFCAGATYWILRPPWYYKKILQQIFLL